MVSRVLLLFALLALSACACGAAEPLADAKTEKRGNGQWPKRIYRTSPLKGSAPHIDGKLDDACWREQGEWSGNYTMLQPKHGGAPTQLTDIKILHDQRNLYVAIRAHVDDPAKFIAIAGDRDQFTGDIVGVCFDSYYDQRSGFEFDLTAAGQKLDVRLFNSSWDTSWNAVWEGKTGREEKAWTAEFMIPLSQLRYVAGKPVWGLHAWRWVEHNKEESDWNLLANDGSGNVKSFGELHGMEDLKSVRRIELTPYLSSKVETFGRRPGVINAGGRETQFNAGVDLKLGLNSSLTLDASLLPDFGQVESDPSVMNLSAFETFLEERRSLFLEGKDIFDFPFDDDAVFYSRRIGAAPGFRPTGLDSRMPETSTLLGAVKLSGKTARGWSIGLLGSVTDEESAEVARNGTRSSLAVEPRTSFLVARIQKELRGGDTTLGGIFTQVSRRLVNDELRAAMPESATVAGFDFTHYWANRKYFAQAVLLGSQIKGDRRAIADLQLSSARYYQRPIDGRTEFDPSRESLSGAGIYLKTGKGSQGRWRWEQSLLVKTPGLELNDLGYLSSSDRIRQETEISYEVKEPKGVYRSYKVSFENAMDWTTHGEYLGSDSTLEMESELANKWFTLVKATYYHGLHDNVALRGGPTLRMPANLNLYAYLCSDESRSFFARAWYGGSRSGENAYSNYDFGGRASYRPTKTLLLSLQMQQTGEQNKFRSVRMQGAETDAWFVSRLDGRSLAYELRAQWIIRPELRLQYYGNPFGLTLRHGEFRRVTHPGADAFADRTGAALYSNYRNGSYYFDENRDGTEDFSLSDPDWNSSSFRSNLVLKWEYRRGSMLYVVWSQQRDEGYRVAGEELSSALSRIRRIAPNNQFMVKATYWFNL